MMEVSGINIAITKLEEIVLFVGPVKNLQQIQKEYVQNVGES